MSIQKLFWSVFRPTTHEPSFSVEAREAPYRKACAEVANILCSLEDVRDAYNNGWRPDDIFLPLEEPLSKYLQGFLIEGFGVPNESNELMRDKAKQYLISSGLHLQPLEVLQALMDHLDGPLRWGLEVVVHDIVNQRKKVVEEAAGG